MALHIVKNKQMVTNVNSVILEKKNTKRRDFFVSENSFINGRKKTKIGNKKYVSLSKFMEVRVH